MRRQQMFWLVSAFFFVAFLGITQAQEKYPSRPIELVVPVGPGGAQDAAARMYSDDLAQELKVPINVVNRAGGGGIQGVSYVVRAKNDGYVLLGSSSDPLTSLPAVSTEATYDALKDLTPLAHFASIPIIIEVRGDSPFRTLKDLVEYARENPGKVKNAAMSVASMGRLTVELMCVRNNVRISTVPFKGGGEMKAALLGGHVDMTTQTIMTEIPLIKSGQIRGLAITSKTRHPDLPEIPTTAELGYPDLNLSTRIIVSAPAALPQSVMSVLVPTLEKVLNSPVVVQRATKLSMIVEYMGPEGLRKLLEAEKRLVEGIIKDAKLKQ